MEERRKTRQHVCASLLIIYQENDASPPLVGAAYHHLRDLPDKPDEAKEALWHKDSFVG